MAHYLDPSIEAATKRWFSGVKCLNGQFSVIVPTYSSDPNRRGCPGSREPCLAKDWDSGRKKKICDGAAEGVTRLMARTFGPGSTSISTVGSWRNPTTGKVEREEGIKISTSFRKSCLTPKKNEFLVKGIDKVMQNTCQWTWFYETERGATLVVTGKARRGK